MIVVEGGDAPLVLGGRDLLEQRVGQERQVGQVDASQDVAVPEIKKMGISVFIGPRSDHSLPMSVTN